jgi:hypothetical protein
LAVAIKLNEGRLIAGLNPFEQFVLADGDWVSHQWAMAIRNCLSQRIPGPARESSRKFHVSG